MVDSCVRVVLSPGVTACVENKCKNWYNTFTCTCTLYQPLYTIHTCTCTCSVH